MAGSRYYVFFLMRRRPPRSPRTATPFPYTPLVRAVGADHSGPRLLPRQPGADVLAGRAFAFGAGTAQAAAHDAVAGLRAARRQAVHGVRHPRRRSAGPVVAAAVPAPRRPWHEPAGGDRLPGLPQRALPELVLAARPQAGAGGGRGADAGRDRRGPVGARSRRAGRGGLVGRSEEHTSELQSLMRSSYAVFCLKKKT